jgi:NAD(P)-dependent dehydrogenase (short-subunit alcohol dehydrogenase family)
MGQLDGRVALVTGASRGIGAGIAKRFAAEGARVVIVARTHHEGDHRRSEGSIDTTLAAIAAAGGEAIGVVANAGEFEECERAVCEARAAFGPVDVLVNNAALTTFAPIAEFKPERWLRTFSVNLHAAFYFSRLVLPEMLERGRGSIVNISSGAARGPGRGPYGESSPMTGGVLYGTTKAALERFTQGLAAEVFEAGICVTALSPSALVPTEGTRFHAERFDNSYPTEPMEMMERAALLLAGADPELLSGRVCYSQQILAEQGWIPKSEASGAGVDAPGSGFSEI